VSLSITGSPVPLPLQIPLSNGWNILGYPRTVPVNALTAFQPLITQNKLVKVQDESGNAVENLPVLGWVNNIGSLRGGEGYYLRVNGAAVLTFAADGSTSSPAPAAAISAAGHYHPVFAGNPFEPMNLYLLPGASSGLLPGDELGLFDGDRCVGSMLVTEQHRAAGLLPITAGMDDPSTEETDGSVPGHPVRVKWWDGSVERSLGVVTSDGSPPLFAARESAVLRLVDEGSVPSTAALLQGYPNPFNPATTIRYTVPAHEPGTEGGVAGSSAAVEIQLAIFDLLGREVLLLVHDRLPPGIYETSFNAAGLASGVYTCRLLAGSRSAMLRLTLVR
jgi:hypothetical protein